MTRVVVTGLGAVTALGSQWDDVKAALWANRSGIRHMPEWADFKGLNCQLAGPVDDFALVGDIHRKKLRSMGRVSQMAVAASRDALQQAGLFDDPLLKSGRVGIAYGSSTGSTDAICEFAKMLSERNLTRFTPTTYIKMMSHTTAVNLGVFFEVNGRVYPTSSACTSGTQAIGFAYEAIASGWQDVMLAGGAEELCPSEAAVFNAFHAASCKNHTPHLTPAPFDADRDGLVIGEGAGTLVLESLEHARARGATIYGEVVGFGTNSDGGHITQPDAQSMQQTMALALQDAGLTSADIDYVNAHGTATPYGDVAESLATYEVFKESTPVSSLKGHLGHSLGASGAIEAWACLYMLREGWVAPTLNLNTPDPDCAPLQYLKGSCQHKPLTRVMSNNFAFGGINTSLIFERFNEPASAQG